MNRMNQKDQTVMSILFGMGVLKLGESPEDCAAAGAAVAAEAGTISGLFTKPL
jgi:hypothetical protein